MSNVSVNIEIVKNAQAVCNEGIQDLNRVAAALQSDYQQAGQGWQDSKYTQLGGIVQECSTAIKKPVQDLIECLNKLKALETALQEYESTSI